MIKKTVVRSALGLIVGFPVVLHAADEASTEPVADGSITALETITVTDKRENRVSKGATGLPLRVKDTPQSISIIDFEEMTKHGVTSSNRALELMTGIDVQQYETNRASFNARGYEIQLTQVDGTGTTNDYATVVGEQDTFLFEKIELIRGANGLLTGVGNASGTVNYVRKRPMNSDQGLASFSLGEYNKQRVAVDYNKVLTEDGSWAARFVAAKEGKESHIRDLENDQTSFYGVLDGQIGEKGVLTMGLSHSKNDQDSPMWGSLTLNYLNGGYADFPVSSSTSADWAFWNTETTNAFIEYVHDLGNSWEAKFSFNWNDYDSQSQLLYAYTNGGGLNDDNTGLIGWPYAGWTEKQSSILDISLSGDFEAFGQDHSVLTGISYTDEGNDTYSRDVISGGFLPYPDFTEFAGDTYAEPVWGEKSKRGEGDKTLTRFYLATRWGITDEMNAILGLNHIKLDRQGASIYGNVVDGTDYPVLEETSPYMGVTYDVTDRTLVYGSYSDIFQNQDNTDYDGNYLDPMEGVNYELGLKSEVIDDMLLTVALFKAEQQGLAVVADGLNADGLNYYVPRDVNSEGIELELSGQVSEYSNLALGVTHLKLTGPDGEDASEWIPRTTVNVRYDTALEQVAGLTLGVNGKWKSDAEKAGGAKQDAHFIANAFASYELTDQATLRLNLYNVFDKKYVHGLAYGAIYGAPRHASLTLDYEF